MRPPHGTYFTLLRQDPRQETALKRIGENQKGKTGSKTRIRLEKNRREPKGKGAFGRTCRVEDTKRNTMLQNPGPPYEIQSGGFHSALHMPYDRFGDPRKAADCEIDQFLAVGLVWKSSSFSASSSLSSRTAEESALASIHVVAVLFRAADFISDNKATVLLCTCSSWFQSGLVFALP
ncbi:hypothetical protein AAHA92_08695 [Salvia divinorum]|uniref:Uncharacterized protein n=1 Tax=Salvia divinorum TaxID=28513 RepID=A0ABD1HQ49_SALDI